MPQLLSITTLAILSLSNPYYNNAFLAPTKPLFFARTIKQSAPQAEIQSSTRLSVSTSSSRSTPTSFSGMVERGIIERFGAENAKRIIESWRLLDKGYEHREFVGAQQDDPILDPSKSNCHQHSHSYVPGLKAKTFWDVNDFEWCKKLAEKYSVIRKEFDSVTSDMDQLIKEGNNIWAGALTDDASSYGEGWRTLVLLDRGTWDPVNVNLFPETAKAVKECGVPAVEVFFASMKPHTSIKMHSDFTNFVLTSHLALDIPESGSNKCRLTVGDDAREWINGEVMLFDTSIMHDAVNESDGTRYILMMRLWHPDLTEVEKQALQFTYDCLEVPELVSTDPGQQFFAEQRINLLRQFPTINKGSEKKPGTKVLGEKKVKKKKKRKGGSGGKGFGTQ